MDKETFKKIIELTKEIEKTKKFYKTGTSPTQYESGYLAGIEHALNIVSGETS